MSENNVCGTCNIGLFFLCIGACNNCETEQEIKGISVTTSDTQNKLVRIWASEEWLNAAGIFGVFFSRCSYEQDNATQFCRDNV